MRLTLVVALFVHPAREADFERFETAATAVMGRHGGRVERRIRIGARTDPGEPDEVHVVTFPDEASFDRYGRDPGDRSARAASRGRHPPHHRVARCGRLGQAHEPVLFPVSLR